MPTVIVTPGFGGFGLKAVDLAGTTENFELTFPADLKKILQNYLSGLDVDTVYDKFVSVSSTTNCVMIAWTGNSYEPRTLTKLCRFKILILKNRNKINTGQDSFAADYTTYRIQKLLLANPTFDGLAGIQEIVTLDSACGPDLPSPEPLEEQESYMDPGMIDITYRVMAPELSKSN